MKLSDIKKAATLEQPQASVPILPVAANVSAFFKAVNPRFAPINSLLDRANAVAEITNQVKDKIDRPTLSDDVRSASAMLQPHGTTILGGIRKQAFYQTLYGKSGETTPLHYGVGGALGGAAGLGIAKMLGKNPFMGTLMGLPLGVLAAEIGGRATRKQRGYR